MTEEEINKKAEKHCNEVLCNTHEKCNEVIKCRDWRSRRAGFFCGYEQALKDFEKENAELKEKVSFSEDNLRVARKDREDLQLDVAKGLKEFVKDYPATALRYLANEKYVEQLTKAKGLLLKLSTYLEGHSNNNFEYELIKEAEQFLNSDMEK